MTRQTKIREMKKTARVYYHKLKYVRGSGWILQTDDLKDRKIDIDRFTPGSFDRMCLRRIQKSMRARIERIFS